MRKWFAILISFSFLLVSVHPLFAQGDPRQGDPTFRKKANHNGNKVNSVFYNYGLVGDTPPEISGEWPIGTGNEYVGDVSPLVGVQHITSAGDTIVSVVTSDGPRGWSDGPPGGGEFWGFEPVPGYADANQDFVATSGALDNDGADGIPGSSDDDGKPDSWPDCWPDRLDDLDDPGWCGQWNGFFGKDVQNADLESYFRFDDARDAEFPIYPDPSDSTRRGLGFEVKGRGLQWAHFLAEDCIFWLYEIINEGTINYEKVAFGMVVGTLSGGRQDSQDDLAYFDLGNDITYSWDEDDRGSPGWVPVSDTRNVGYVGYAFLESPGISVDGIDNDGDASLGTAPRFTPSDFGNRTINAGDQLVSIHPTTYERSLITVPNESFQFESQGRTYTIIPGQTIVEEFETDIFDNDFDGLINESFEAHFNQLVNPDPQYDIEPRPALQYINYFTGAGLDDPMIDEDRFDGIDNDGDWDPSLDDVGADGVAGTADTGEGDGVPTPGEPHFDQTDVDESDQIGLTSFEYFSPPGQVRMSNDPQLWDRLTPGTFDVIPGQAEDGDFVYGSGYFPVPSLATQWFSFALVYGEDFDDILNNKITVQSIYDENYNFARPPDKPTLRAYAGDGYVTLYWDAEAESSFDPVAGYDFEGYKVYRSTDPYFNEVNTITDGFGRKIFYEPIATFDIFNEYSDFFPIDFQGVQFYLGKNNGLRHSYTDSTVTNGMTYYYAVTAYDHGIADPDKVIFPAETTRSILKDASGNVTLDINTAMVTPNPQVTGYIPPTGSETIEHISGNATGDLFVSILDPTVTPDGHTFEVVFEDTSYFQRKTAYYSVYDITASPRDTILYRSSNLAGESDIFPGLGMRLILRNDPQALVNPAESGWGDEGGLYGADVSDTFPRYTLQPINLCNLFVGQRSAFDYEIRILASADGVSVQKDIICIPGIQEYHFQALPINFKVRNTSTGTDVDVVYSDAEPLGQLSRGDEIIFLEMNEDTGEEEPTWYIILSGSSQDIVTPEVGDILYINTFTPFNRDDVYRFTTNAPGVDDDISESELDKIKVVPNPYVAAALWEQDDPYRTSRGERRIDFIHIPQGSTIRIYTVRGELIQTLHHNGGIFDGTVSWDLRTKDGISAAYGVYVFHVDAPGIGEKIGKFALIK